MGLPDRNLIPEGDSSASHSDMSTQRRKTIPGAVEELSADHPERDSSVEGHTARASEPEDTFIEYGPPPPYSESYDTVALSQDGFSTNAKVAGDGRIDIKIDQRSQRLPDLIIPALKHQVLFQKSAGVPSPHKYPNLPDLSGISGSNHAIPLSIVIHVVGSRGDVQPFIALAQELKRKYGHRIRLATHPVFRQFVIDNGLEFFSIGGDPAELMAFMVRNPGLMPGKNALQSGDIGKRRKEMYEIIHGCWRSCYEAGDGTGIPITDGSSLDDSDQPFVADAIIANPPSMAHVHCAEKLGIPLHLMFTMPWSPTQSFPHPLANIQSSNADSRVTNFMSYVLVEMMTWQGLGDIVNRFRERSLGLEAISMIMAPNLIARLKIPYTYCWSPALIPKPRDWGQHISVSGFYFLSLAGNYHPNTELEEFLERGPPPVYIGFGSIVVDDPNSLTTLIFDAIRHTGQRALVSKGWGGLGAGEIGVPDGVLMLDNVPHDWLFERVSCVVHHGGAGTTAIGIAKGKPTVIVPFFGDQPFWGAMVAKAGAGPEPIPYKNLTSETLASSILQALSSTTVQQAQSLRTKIASEQGSEVGAKLFHKALDIEKLKCSLCPDRVAVFRLKNSKVPLSGLAAATLCQEALVEFKDLELYRPVEYDMDIDPIEPISGATSALLGTIGSFMMGAADVPFGIFKSTSKKGEEESSESPGRYSKEENEKAIGSPSEQLSQTKSISESRQSRQSASESSEKTKEAISNSSISRRESEQKLPKKGNDTNQITMANAVNAGRGFSRMLDAGLKSPMDFTMSLARGFHNAPRLYGDQSVRPDSKVTGFQSGMRAAGKEFGFGFYDGISGLVKQPLEGAKTEGLSGFVKGFGKGIGGVVLKPGAGIWGLPGYTFKGIYKEFQKRFGASVKNYIITARIALAQKDLEASSQQERARIAKGWLNFQREKTVEKKQPAQRSPRPRAGHESILGVPPGQFLETRDTDSTASYVKSFGNFTTGNSNRGFRGFPSTQSDEELENAISTSVQATSTGDMEEDTLIERAIRASLQELREQREGETDDEILQRAIKASIAEASGPRLNPQSSPDHSNNDESSYEAELNAAIQNSLTIHNNSGTEPHKREGDDERKVKFGNKELNPEDVTSTWQEESSTAKNKESKTWSDEDIVMEYVKKQSLLENRYQKENKEKHG